MPLINQIKSLQEQGLTEMQIIQKLQEQGFSPLEISQGLEQSKIKSAVQEEFGNDIGGEMQQSVMQTAEEQTAPLPEQATQTTEQTQEYIYPTPQAYPQAYQQYQEYQPYSSAESITEIAEQIAEEKVGAVKREITNMQEFRLVANRKIENVDDRLKKIEETIDRLQSTIIGKVGSFAGNIQDIKQEMEMMQESFSKALNPLISKTRAGSKGVEEGHTKETRKRKSDGFEHYLRR